MDNDLIERLRKRAQISRSEPDRISDILEEAANALEKYQPMTQQEFDDDKYA